MPHDRAGEAAPAKINLFLHVLGRRPDGFHVLDSLAVFAGVADRVNAVPAEDLLLSLTGPEAAKLRDDAAENLVLRAARALRDATGAASGAAITLEKNLPVASGIGGGSADAAAALRLLARLWSLRIPDAELAALAQCLGSDVPVCLAARPARMNGLGEVLRPAPTLPEFGLLLVNPGVSVRTPEVFAARSGAFSEPAALPSAWPDAAAMAASLRPLANDLQEPAIRLCPAIGSALDAVRSAPGCLLARMSGSGATCFGLFATADAAGRAAAMLAVPSAWWVWGGAPFAANVEAAPAPPY